MAHIRTIKPEFFIHDRLYEGERQSGLPLRVAFAGLWCQADREGRFKWRPAALKTGILPYDDVDFCKVLDTLAAGGHIVKYTDGTNFYGYIPSWKEHQRINGNEAPSTICSPADAQLLPSCSTDVQQVSNSSATVVPQEGKGRERKGKERKGNNPPTPLAKFEPEIQAVVAHLTKVTGRRFDASKATDQILRAMRDDRATVQDCCMVIDYLWQLWGHKTDMRTLVDKTTPFRKANFSRYLDSANAGPGRPAAQPTERTPVDRHTLAEAEQLNGDIDSRRAWIRSKPKEWQPRLAIAAGIYDWEV